MNKIVIIGACGSGKTTLARQLSSKLDIASADLDDLHWRPGWVEADRQEFRHDIEQIVSKDKWIISGNYRKVSTELIWPYADTLIWIDYGFIRTLYQLLGRTYARVMDQQEICNGNYETLKQTFSKDSIILWYFQSYKERQKHAAELFDDKPLENIENYIRLTSPRHFQEMIEN